MDKVLVIGSGGREHAIARKIAESHDVEKVYCAPGNGGTAVTEKCENVSGLKTNVDMFDFAKSNKVALTVVGPEDSLANGIVDLLAPCMNIFGPKYWAARLESSKADAKSFMEEHGVPTAKYKIFHNADAAFEYIDSISHPVFVKASGLALGKGALDGSTKEKARQAVERIMVKKEFGEAGDKIVIEDYLTGEEVSAMALINTHNGLAIPLLPSQDHKRLEDGDNGRNTGGMGAYAPTSLVTPELSQKIYEKIIQRTVNGLKDKSQSYRGVIYPGIMVVDGEPFVLEYNVRFGDPETQPVLTLLESDLYHVLNGVLDGSLKPGDLKWKDGHAVCVVAVSGGYPGSYVKGKEIIGLDDAAKLDDVIVYHAGTKSENGKFYTNGGRVLGITAYGKTIGDAIEKAYEAVDRIKFDGMFFRKDIGHREIARGVRLD